MFTHREYISFGRVSPADFLLVNSNKSLFGSVVMKARAFFNIYTGGAKAPPAPTLAPPLKGFGPPSNVPFCLKMSDNHAEIAGNQV